MWLDIMTLQASVSGVFLKMVYLYSMYTASEDRSPSDKLEKLISYLQSTIIWTVFFIEGERYAY